MKLADVRVVWLKELRETLRDRRTLAVMLLFPLVVYPLIALLMTEVMAGKQATDATRVSRVAIVGGEAADREAVRALLAPAKPAIGSVGAHATANDKPSSFEIVDERRAIAMSRALPLDAAASGPIAEALASGGVDAVIVVGATGPAPRALRIVYDETHAMSEQAHDRLTHVLEGALPAGCAPTFAVSATSVASRTKVGGFVLSKIVPLVVVIMTMLGAFYPAIDITAGERERGTLETVLASPIRRFDLMAGKVLAVATLATLTGALNIVSMSLTVAETARLAAGSAVLSVPWTRALATLLIVVPAAFLFASVMVAIGAMARGFKEAQTMLMPVYLLCLTPSLVSSVGDYPLAGVTLLVPGTNLTLLGRDVMLGTARVLPAFVVLASTVAFGAAALAFAARLYDSERLLASSDADNVGLRAWLRHLLGRAPAAASDAPAVPATPSHALALFGVAFILWFFVFTWLQRWKLVPGLLLSQWGGFFGLVWLYARLSRRRLADVLGWRRPHPAALVGAVCLGLSCWIILGALADRLMPPPREIVESLRTLIRPPDGSRPLWLSLFALAVTPALCEEALFRGPILRGLRGGLSTALASVLTGVLFGVLHGDVWRFVPTALLGALLSWMTLRSGSIIPAMLTHAINNCSLVVLGYFGLDEAGEHLSSRANVLLLGGAVALLCTGLLAVRAGRVRDTASSPASPSLS